MSVAVTRTIQIVALLIAALSLFGILGSRGDVQLIAGWGAALGVAVVIFLLAAILRVLSDVSEKVLGSMGYKREEKREEVIGNL